MRLRSAQIITEVTEPFIKKARRASFSSSCRMRSTYSVSFRLVSIGNARLLLMQVMNSHRQLVIITPDFRHTERGVNRIVVCRVVMNGNFEHKVRRRINREIETDSVSDRLGGLDIKTGVLHYLCSLYASSS